MSVTIAKAIVSGLRDFGVTVHESDGCYSRGNGNTSAYMGLIVHHTGGDYGKDYKALYDGRPDLSGPSRRKAAMSMVFPAEVGVGPGA